MHFKVLYILFFVYIFFIPNINAAEQLEVVVSGVEGDALENVKTALSIPDGLIENGKINMEWLDYFKSQAGNKVKTAVEPYGYYNPKVTVSLETVDAEHYKLMIEIKPGEPIRITEVNITVNGPGSDEKALQAFVSDSPLHKGDVLLHTEYEKTKGALKSKALEMGYLDAEFSLHQIFISKKELSARIELVLETGPQYYFGETHFEGATNYPEKFLKRYLAYKNGKVFFQKKLGETQINLINSERFTEVIISGEKEKMESLRIPILIRLKPSPSKRLRIGIGYGTDIGAKFSIRYTDLNVLKHGNELRAELNISQRLQGMGINYVIPSLKNINSLAGFQLNIQQEDVDSYKTSLASFEVNRTKSFGRGRLGTIYLKLQQEESKIASVKNESFLVLPGMRFSERRYDNLIRPSRGYGYSVEVRGTHTYLGSDIGFIQILLEGNIMIHLPSRFSLLSRMKGGTTFLEGSFSDLPASFRFFTGGDRSVRGYKYQSLGPKDEKGDVVGGKHLIVGSVELERALFKDWGIAAFYDIGNSFNSLSDITFFQGVGFGIRYYTRIGALRIDIARQVRINNPIYRVHFTMGLEL